MENCLLNELSRLTLSVEHFLLDRIESDFFRCLRFQTHLIGVDIFFISASVSLVRTGYILALNSYSFNLFWPSVRG